MLFKLICRYLFGTRDNRLEFLDESDYVLPDLGSGEPKIVFVAAPIRGIDRGKLTFGQEGMTITSTEYEGGTIKIQGEKRITFLAFAMVDVLRLMKKCKQLPRKE